MTPGSRFDIALTCSLLALGLGATTYGLWQFYSPAAWIFAGVVALRASGFFTAEPTREVSK